MQNRKTFLLAGTAILALAGQLYAGGFFLTIENPAANPEARKAGAVLVVRSQGCHDPAGASVSATAIGVVNGERRAIPLKVSNLSEPGLFAITQQWPNEGQWIIQLAGRNEGAVTTTLVKAGPKGVEHKAAKLEMRAFTVDEVYAMLR